MSAKFLSSETACETVTFVTVLPRPRASTGPDGELTVNGADATSEGTEGVTRRQQTLKMEPLTAACSQHGDAHSAPLALLAVKTQTPAVNWATNATAARNFFMRQSTLVDDYSSCF